MGCVLVVVIIDVVGLPIKPPVPNKIFSLLIPVLKSPNPLH